MTTNIASFGARAHLGDHSKSTFWTFLGILIPNAVGASFVRVFFLRSFLFVGF